MSDTKKMDGPASIKATPGAVERQEAARAAKAEKKEKEYVGKPKKEIKIATGDPKATELRMIKNVSHDGTHYAKGMPVPDDVAKMFKQKNWCKTVAELEKEIIDAAA